MENQLILKIFGAIAAFVIAQLVWAALFRGLGKARDYLNTPDDADKLPPAPDPRTGEVKRRKTKGDRFMHMIGNFLRIMMVFGVILTALYYCSQAGGRGGCDYGRAIICEAY